VNRRLGERRTAGGPTLMEIAKQLGNGGLDEVIASYQEINIAKSRIYAVLFALAWAAFWYVLGPGDVPKTPRAWNYPQALAAAPVIVPMLFLSIAWWLALKRKWIKQSIWTDVIGALANIIAISLLLYRAWDLFIAFICYLPMAAITVGARFNRMFFYGYIALSVLVTQFAAPSNYWFNRPHFALFAITLVCFLPLSIGRLLQTIRSVSEEAIRSRDAQSRFVATMSHEFRTPLNSVINNAELIDTDGMSESQQQIVESLTSAAMALRNRVNEVLDVRAIDAGKLAIVEEPFTFCGLLKTVKSVVGPQALAKNIEFKLCADQSISDVVLRSDPGRLEQVLINITNNAVKFTPEEGRVELCVSEGETTKDGRVNVVVTVTDTGPGIPDAEKDRIWLPFHQVSSGAKRTHEGIGLGLFIVSSVVKFMGGKVTVTDRPGGGSVFHVVLSISKAGPGERPVQYFNLKEAVTEHRRRVRPMRCLVVDDKASNREIAERLLTLVGHSMVGASSGLTGIHEARSGTFDVILLDLHMPEVDGSDVLKALRQDPLFQTPIVMVSADADPTAIAKTKELGASGYITKPISFAKLLALLEEISKSTGERKDVVILNSDSDVDSFSGLDVMRASGDIDATRSFINTCIKGIEENLESMYNALRRGDRTGAFVAAHALKNEYLNVGYSEGALACGEFRDALQQGTADIVLHRIAAMADMLKYKLRNEELGNPVNVPLEEV